MVTDDETGIEFNPETTDHYEVSMEYTPEFSENQQYTTQHYQSRKYMNRYLRKIYETANPNFPCNITIRRKLAPKPPIPVGYKLFLNSMYGKTPFRWDGIY